MKPEHALAVQYDLALSIGAETRVQPLLERVLQRLLFHTSFPAGMVLLDEARHGEARIAVALGSRALMARTGQPLRGATDGAGWLDAAQLAALELPDDLRCGLRLPIPQHGAVILLAPQPPASQLPLDQVLLPVLRNLSRAIELCRAHEERTDAIERDRDRARHDLGEALRQSEEQRRLLRLLTNTLPDLFWLKDPDGRYLFCNRGFERLYGTPEAALLGRTDGEFVDADLAAFFRAKDLAAVANAGPTVNEEWLSFADDGHRGLFETTKIPVRDESGQLLGIMGVARDVTARHQADQQLLLAASVFTHAREGIMITAPDGAIIDVNAAFTRITGYQRDEVLGRNPRLLQSGRQSPEFYAQMWRELRQRGHWQGELWNRRRNGELFVEQLTISAVHDAAGAVLHFVALFSDITRQKEHERQLERIAHYDVLTALPNRVLLADRLQQAMLQARRRRQLLAVACLDLDGFKAINDQHGHRTGDHFLAAIAERLQQVLRDGDTLARLGGDEFVAVLHDLRSPQDADGLLQRLLRQASDWLEVDGRWLHVTASIGVAYYGDGEDLDPDQLMRQADQAMYQAKQAGKNQFRVFDPALDRDARGQHESLEQISRALRSGQFVLHYQPKVNLRSGALAGVEALVRWQHPERGLLEPAHFLPVIEHHRLAVDLGEWVLDAAMTQAEAWQRSGLDTSISVNIGARHLQQADFVARLDALLARHPGVPPRCLQLEIVETSALHDIGAVSRLLEACAARGVLSGLDDFGTGYSSLSYLKRLPARQLKIDQSFVRDMLVDPDDLAILEAVLGLARAFGREVVAEGIETVDHGVMLLQLGCEMGQGYGIALPMPAAELPGWLQRWRPDPRWCGTPTLSPVQAQLLHAAVELRAQGQAVEACLDGRSDSAPSLAGTAALERWLDRAPQAGSALGGRYRAWLGAARQQLTARQAGQPLPSRAVRESLRQQHAELLDSLDQLLPGGLAG